MVLYNAATKELTAKIVYYGPGLGGKTTNLQLLHDRLEQDTVGRLLSLSTQTDRTIYFDMLPVDLGEIKGYQIRFQLATVPGQTAFNETRKVVLRGADGIVFVADSRGAMLPKNLESWQNLKDNAREIGLSFETLPIVIQYNKRDLSDILSIEQMQEALGLASYPFAEAVATAGRGITETFKLISKLTFVDLVRRLQGSKPEESAAASPASEPSPEAPRAEAPPPSPPEPARAADEARLAALEARLAAIEERAANDAEARGRLVAATADAGQSLAASQARFAALEERIGNDAQERRRLAESASEWTEKLTAAQARLAAIEERLEGDAEERRLFAGSAAESAQRLAAAESRLEEHDAARRTAQQDARDALSSLSAHAEKISGETAGLARRVEALEGALAEETAQARREAAEIRSQIASLVEAQAERRASDRETLDEIDRLRDALADSLAEISERLRRAVPKA